MVQEQMMTQTSDGRPVHLVTKTGIRLNVRQASVGDEPEMLGFLEAVSPDDLRFRFLNAVTPSAALAHLLTQANREDVVNLLAFDAADGRLGATATIAEESSQTAEVAVVVRSDLKGHGIGWSLLGYICDLARVRGFRRLECIESSENRTAMQLEEEFGFTREEHPGDATVTILSKRLQ